MFRAILLFAWTLIHLYVFWRAGTVPAVARLVRRRYLFGAGALLWSSFFLYTLGRGREGLPSRLLELFVMDWLAAMFLIFVALLAADLVSGFGFLLPRIAPRLRGWALLAGASLSLFAVVQGTRPPVVSRHEVRIPGLPRELDGTVLVALSDLHLGSLLGERWLAARVEQVRSLRPDMVILLGDLVEGHGRPDGDLLPVMRRLDAPLGVWAVRGNHESHGGGEETSRLLREAGFHELRNNRTEVRPGLVLAGVDYGGHGGGLPRTDGALAGKVLEGRPPGAAVLLSHSPREAASAAAAGADLMLSGHTHAGQVWPFGYLVRMTTPFLSGRYRVGEMTLIVCRGTGTWGPRMRLWRPSEILRVTLRPGE